jgi:hypothetical protein
MIQMLSTLDKSSKISLSKYSKKTLYYSLKQNEKRFGRCDRVKQIGPLLALQAK